MVSKWEGNTVTQNSIPQQTLEGSLKMSHWRGYFSLLNSSNHFFNVISKKPNKKTPKHQLTVKQHLPKKTETKKQAKKQKLGQEWNSKWKRNARTVLRTDKEVERLGGFTEQWSSTVTGICVGSLLFWIPFLLLNTFSFPVLVPDGMMMMMTMNFLFSLFITDHSLPKARTHPWAKNSWSGGYC